jgi:hypothetical protein
MRLGIEGYTNKVGNQMRVAEYIRGYIRQIKHPSGKHRFQMLDGGEKDENCLPVVAARLNPELALKYDDIDLQHALSESHWYVSGYTLGFENFANNAIQEPLFTDMKSSDTMFRIVVKSNLTMGLAQHLMTHLSEVLPVLDSMEAGYSSMKSTQAAVTNCIIKEKATHGELSAVLAASKWLRKASKNQIREQSAKLHPRRSSILPTC